jgi:LysR family transcriptional regulator, cyn operon transcriptional activator
MELRHFRYFVALAEELSFTRAGERMHVTQSTLSHQIKQLEGELGHRLFDRDKKRVTITEAGENLLGNMTKVLREIDDSIRAMKGESDPLTGSLRIGTTHTFNTKLLPGCLARFLNKHTSVSVIVSELCAAEIETELSEGRIDIGIGYLPTEHRDLSFEPLYLEEMVLAVSAKHPLASRKRVRLAELHRQPLVLATQESATRRMLNQRFEAVGAQPFVAAEIDAIGPALDLARQTCIGAIVSEVAITDATELHVIALEDPIPLRTPGILWKAGAPRSAPCRSFATLVRQTVSHARMRMPEHGRKRPSRAMIHTDKSMRSIY